MSLRDTKQIKATLKDYRAILACARQFGLVGDPTRMKICWLLCQNPELSVGDIADVLGVSISAVSHSLRRLRKNQLVQTRREEKRIYYHLVHSKFTNVLRSALTN